MDVGAERAAKRQPVGAGLLLDDAPGPAASALHGEETIHQFGPLYSRMRFDDPALGVESEYLSHRAGVEQHGAIGELLAAHGVAAAANADRLALRARATASALRSAGSELMSTTRSTRVGLSCEWMSLTTVAARVSSAI